MGSHLQVLARLQRKLDPAHLTHLTSTDLEASRIFWIKATQKVYFPHELKALQSHTPLLSSHVFSRLTAFLDNNGVIRVGGRISHSQLDPDSKHPIILPRHSQFTSLVIDETHRKTLHGGTQLTLATIRQRYWIIGGRAPVKSHILKCVLCARHRGIRAQQLMGQLPASRVQPSRPFLHTGVDYAGPLTLKTWKGRGSKTHKGWVCVFVCFASSAVHLEVVSDYSTDSFLAAFRRFTARRGICHTLYSDCGTTFIGADTALKELFTKASSQNQTLSNLLLNEGTTWCFNPPAAPHMGGKWEAVVKSFKHHFIRTVKDVSFTLEEIMTLTSQIEAILNSRPLEPLSDDPDDCVALTPGHLLIGAPLTAVPEPSLEHLSTSRLSRWQFVQQRTQQFWTQWSSQYLQRQLSISKWHHPRNDVKVGSLVLITDERTPPCKWPLARVLDMHPGHDGLTRVVTLKTPTTTLRRPVAKLCILPILVDSED
ncbi:uncharacterized protein LOC123316981 [Coccinella septempunctata]|uniref:uncharacterized protein LOC123316981 n=1 Tax=Coccinella septempunctata TaxID=41139 RepID=UPI001D09603F|nr:uncharacterized protein LOC123316981 [Coccinella septempunctata]